MLKVGWPQMTQVFSSLIVWGQRLNPGIERATTGVYLESLPKLGLFVKKLMSLFSKMTEQRDACFPSAISGLSGPYSASLRDQRTS